MKFSTSALLASTAALVAANGNNTIGTGDRFYLMTESSQPPLQDGLIGIYKKGLGVNVKQDINCPQTPAQTYATLSINNFGGLFLYTPGSPVQAYVDRSPEGKGAIGFTTGVQTPENPNYQRYTFELSEEGNLQFVDGDKRFGLQACPVNPDDLSYKDGWTVWLDEFEKPTGAACYPFITKAILKNNIMMCSYAGLTKASEN